MKRILRRILPLLWMAAYLVAIDFAVNAFFRYPKDPKNVSPSGVQQFFEYGRSVEGKLSRMTRPTADASAPIVSVGWLDSRQDNLVSGPEADAKDLKVTVYGMSHAVILSKDIVAVDKSLTVRSVGAPGALPTWSYPAYLSDREKYHSDVVVMGIMTRGVSFLGSTSGITNRFDSVFPSTYPRFFLEQGALKSVPPPFVSCEGYIDAFYNPEKWAGYVAWLEKYDKYYDPFLFRRTILDKSAIVRMIRRAYSASFQRKKEDPIFSYAKGFNLESEEVKILRALVVEFAEKAKRDNSLPIIYIVNNLFTGEHLFKALEPTLAAHRILYLSSHEICPPNDPRYFLPDSHFIPSKGLELARAIVKIMRENAAPGSSGR